MQLGHTEHALADVQETVKVRDVAIDPLDEAHVDRRRHVVRVEGVLERRAVLPGAPVEQHLLHLGVHHRAEGAAVLAERGEVRRLHRHAVIAVRRRAQLGIARVVHFRRAAVTEGDDRVGEVGIREDAEDRRGSGGERTDVGQQLLFGVAQRVCGTPQRIAQFEGVDRQARFGGDEGLDRVTIGAQDLGLHVRRLGAERRVELRHLLRHALVDGDAGVLVREHVGVDVEAQHLLAQRAAALERIGQHRRRPGEPATPGAHRRHGRGDAVLLNTPGVERGIEVLELPDVPFGDGGAISFGCDGCGHGRCPVLFGATTWSTSGATASRGRAMSYTDVSANRSRVPASVLNIPYSSVIPTGRRKTRGAPLG